MPSPYETNLYDLHLLFEVGYDEVPVIRAYETYINKDGEVETTTSYIADRYEYTEADIAWVIETLSDQTGNKYKTIDDLYSDEWFTSADAELLKLIPPNAQTWVKCLCWYTAEDHTSIEILNNYIKEAN